MFLWKRGLRASVILFLILQQFRGHVPNARKDLREREEEKGTVPTMGTELYAVRQKKGAFGKCSIKQQGLFLCYALPRRVLFALRLRFGFS